MDVTLLLMYDFYPTLRFSVEKWVCIRGTESNDLMALSFDVA